MKKPAHLCEANVAVGEGGIVYGAGRVGTAATERDAPSSCAYCHQGVYVDAYKVRLNTIRALRDADKEMIVLSREAALLEA